MRYSSHPDSSSVPGSRRRARGHRSARKSLPDDDWGVWFVNGAHDIIDRRIVESVRGQTGTSHVNTTGPWPDLLRGAPAPPADSDHDGMPDAWEIAHDLDPGNASDGAAVAANGYTQVENYLNELAGDPVPGVGTKPASAPPP